MASTQTQFSLEPVGGDFWELIRNRTEQIVGLLKAHGIPDDCITMNVLFRMGLGCAISAGVDKDMTMAAISQMWSEIIRRRAKAGVLK